MQLLLNGDAVGTADIAELARRADFRRRRSGRRLLIYSGRRRERRVPIPEAFARERSRAVESAGRLARRRCADLAGRADRRGVCHGSSRRRCSRSAPALVGEDRLGGPRLDTWRSRCGFRSRNRPGAHSLSPARRGRTIATRDVPHDLARVGDDPVQQRQTCRRRRAGGQRRSDGECGGRSHFLSKTYRCCPASAGSPARLDDHRRLPRVDDRRRRLLVLARPAAAPRPSSSSAAARSRSGRRASACTPPTPARSATSRSRRRRSRRTGST